jgi:hypothetical protein
LLPSIVALDSFWINYNGNLTRPKRLLGALGIFAIGGQVHTQVGEYMPRILHGRMKIKQTVESGSGTMEFPVHLHAFHRGVL